MAKKIQLTLTLKQAEALYAAGVVDDVVQAKAGLPINKPLDNALDKISEGIRKAKQEG